MKQASSIPNIVEKVNLKIAQLSNKTESSHSNAESEKTDMTELKELT